MPSRRSLASLVVILGVMSAGAAAYIWSRPLSDKTTIFGVVRATEVRVAPEVGGILSTIEVKKGADVRAGAVVATLSAIELSASLAQARAVRAAAISDRNNVYAGVRAEQIAAFKAEVSKAKSKLEYAELQRSRAVDLAQSNAGSLQARDQAEDDAAAARNDVAQAEANYAAAVAGPTEAERAIADAQVGAATSAVLVLERRLEKTTLRAPVDGTVSIVVGELGEAISAGEPVFVIEEADKQWLSFNAREDRIHGLSVGDTIGVARLGVKATISARVTELMPLGQFATWQAERAVGDHDLNTLRLRLDPIENEPELKPGMTVSFAR
jgi:HlyD family secretion protein